VDIQKRYLTEREVSELTGLAVPTLRNWRHLGRGPVYHKVPLGGRAVRYFLEDVLAFMGEGRIQRECEGHLCECKKAVRE
jgi:predicted DNA-binding transcriptional regulator AlpA